MTPLPDGTPTSAEVLAKIHAERGPIISASEPQRRADRGPEAPDRPRASAPTAQASADQPSSADAAADDLSGETHGHMTVAQALIAIGARSDLFHDERGDAYAVTMDKDVRRTLRLRGRDFRRWLCGCYYAETGRAANGEAIAAALGVLEAKATFSGARIALSNRLAEQDGAVYIDLCDERWRAVRVTADGWTVLDKPPVMFRRYAHQQALPEPERGGDLSALRPFLNLRNQQDQHLIEAWLATAPFAHAPRPVLMLHGPQGAAKSTLARALKSLLDPSATDTIDLGRDPGALALVLDHNAVPCFDNVSALPTWASDMLCKAVTGGGFSKRELYTDAEDVILAFKRAVIVTGINIPTHAPDLLDRTLLIELERIDPARRRDERAFWADFDAARPRLFGALLDAVSGILRHRHHAHGHFDGLPRMADFALLACAYAEHAEIGAGRMMTVIMDNTAQQTQEVIESDPVAAAVRDFAEKHRRWEGTPSQLLEALSAPFATSRAFPEGWPRSAKSMGRRLTVLQATLAEVGVRVTRTHSRDKRSRIIDLAVGDTRQTSETSGMSGANQDAASVTDVSSGPRSANVRETSDPRHDAGAEPDDSDVSDVSLHDAAAPAGEVF
jgi:hypothetical protein